MYPKPIIGVPADRRVIDPHPYHMVGEKYLTALIDVADSLPLLIPVLAEHLDVDEVLDQIDGILLPGSYSMIEPHHFPPVIYKNGSPPKTRQMNPVDKKEKKKQRLIDALERSNGNQSKAAELLGISRVTVWNQMRQFNISYEQGKLVY